MKKEFKEETLKTTGINLKVEHIEFLATHGSGSKYIRWLLDNDSGFKKFQRDKERK